MELWCAYFYFSSNSLASITVNEIKHDNACMHEVSKYHMANIFDYCRPTESLSMRDSVLFVPIYVQKFDLGGKQQGFY